MADKQSTDEMMDTMAIPEPGQDKMDSESAQETAAAEMSNDDRQESAVENTAEAATGSEIDVAAIDSLFEAEEFAMPTAKKTVVATAFGVVAASQLRTPAERKRRRTNRIPR
jgi:tRNA A37 threonylcarbamoyltransferase TsaD